LSFGSSVEVPFRRRGAAWRLAALLALTPASSFAQGVDDHGAAQALVAQVQQDTARLPVTAEALANAKGALERAARFRTAGDEAHAKAADGLALEWAQVARDLARAASIEASGAEVRQKAVDAQAKLERARAQVEEGIARVGRLQAELAETERAPKVDRVAVEVHEGDDRHKTASAGTARKTTAPRKSSTKRTGGAP
jgi:hypothetical protein